MPETPFDSLHPKDGFRIFDHDLGKVEITLHVGMWGENEMYFTAEDGGHNTAEIWTAKCPTVEDYGRRGRAMLVMEAVANYFNAGGDWDELESMLREARQVMQGGLVVPGYHVLDCYTDTEGHFTVVYVKDGTDEVVRWVRGEFIDTGLTLADLQRELEEEDELDARQQSRVHRLREISDREDSEAPEEDEGGDSGEPPGPSEEGI